MYQHRFATGFAPNLPDRPSKIVCVGQNYADHIAEMGSKVAPEPMLFIKTVSCARPMEQPFGIPTGFGQCHFETEMSVLVRARLSNATEAEARSAMVGVGLAFDLTLRDLQAELKSRGHPWEKAKGFDGSCPLSVFAPVPEDFQALDLCLTRNGVLTQNGNTAQMLTQVVPLLAYASRFFTFEPGDVLLTGTPAGVGPLASGDQLVAELGSFLRVQTQVQ